MESAVVLATGRALTIMAGIAKAICIMQWHWAKARRWAKQGHEAK
jgi:hypothetical protein